MDRRLCLASAVLALIGEVAIMRPDDFVDGSAPMVAMVNIGASFFLWVLAVAVQHKEQG
jgi:hypothetical protein